MHNKRLGRDDILKIEVRKRHLPGRSYYRANKLDSGRAHHHQHPGVSILAAMIPAVGEVSAVHPAVVIALLVVDPTPHPVVAAAITLHAKTIVASATTIGVTATALEALTTETAR